MATHMWTIAAAVAAIAASNVTAVQAEQARMGQQDNKVATTSANYSKSMDELMRAAQRLRESIQALAQQQPGLQRDRALRAARDALHDTQAAMIQLPPHLRNPQRAAGVAPAYSESMRHLQAAADRLHNSLHAMAKQPAGERRDAAMREAQEALFEAEYAMVWLPNDGRPDAQRLGARSRPSTMAEAASARGVAVSRAGTGAVGAGAVAAGSDLSQVSGSAEAVAGGVGINARAKLSNEAAPDHNVKLVFSLNTGNYLADVDVKVTDRSGRTVVNGTADGPWLYAKLPPGTYTATATYRGHFVTEKFTVGRSGQRVAHLRWPAHIENQAAATSATSPILGTGPQEAQR